MGTNTRLENIYDRHRGTTQKNGFELPKSALVNKIAKSDRLRICLKKEITHSSRI